MNQTVASASVISGPATIPTPWDSWQPATCMPDHCFCEAVRPSAVAQPANALSSLAFCLVAGLVLARRGPRVRPKPDAIGGAHPASQRKDAYLFASALLLIGIGSAFYHASLSFVGQTLDVLGMYLLATAIILWNLRPRSQLSARAAVSLYAGANAVLLGTLIALPALRRYLFVALLAAVLYSEWRTRRAGERADRRYLWTAIALLAIGSVFWVADITGTLCSPYSWLQGHALWHVVGAASAGLVYFHYHRHPAAQA